MNGKKILKFFFIIFFLLILLLIIYSKFSKNKQINNIEPDKDEEIVYKSNIIKNVNYTTTDNDGNEYIINALQGEIDYSNPNIIYLTKVSAFIKLRDSSLINISSDYGKYNSNNFDTIFTKNVIIKYLDNKINGEYVDFSLERNSMIVSKNVVYRNLQNTLQADVIEIDIKTKDTKIFMHEKDKKVNIQSIN